MPKLLPLALLLAAGCDGGSSTARDMAGGDLAMGAPDLAAAADLALGGAATGEACAKAMDCAGTRPQCILKDARGITWPNGYCVSACNPTKNDPKTGINNGCPGGKGTCIGQGTMGVCERACTASDGMDPCSRMGYSCFQSCRPTALSNCNPTIKGVCDMGAACARIGEDPVGLCSPACDPFVQMCPDEMGNRAGCYASDETGEGFCFTVFGGGIDGAACVYTNACDPGLICYEADPMANMGVCRPYCGGSKNVACTNGKTCVDLSKMVAKSTLGVCGG